MALSGTYRRYKKDFLLSEAVLRKINEILVTHAKKRDFGTFVRFHVYNSDNSFYKTKNIDDVLSDDNAGKKRIERLLIELVKDEKKDGDDSSKGKPVLASIDFDQNDEAKIYFSVDDEDRDWCFLLADEIETQVKRAIHTSIVPLVKQYWFQSIVHLLASIIFAFIVFVILDKYWIPFELSLVENDSAKGLLSNANTLVKSLVSSLFGIVLLITLNHGEILDEFVEKMSGSYFYWGDELMRLQNIAETKRKIWWGIVVAFLVSLVAGIIASQIT